MSLAKRIAMATKVEPAPQQATQTTVNGRTIYPGQLTEEQLRELIRERGEAAAARRLAWLQDHQDWIPCAVAGCSGLVTPTFQRLASNGTVYGFCPRRSVHARLMPGLFITPSITPPNL
jgi:hypothetical protein